MQKPIRSAHSGFGAFLAFEQLLFAPLFGPAFFYRLASPAERQRVSRNVVSNSRTGCDIRAFIDPDGRYERGIAADECAIFDHSYMLGRSIVVAGNSACTHVHACPNFCIAQVSKVIGLGTSA